MTGIFGLTEQDFDDLIKSGPNGAAVRAIREWCDRTAAAASTDQSEPVFQARMELVDEVSALLPSGGGMTFDREYPGDSGTDSGN
jgi:hypothetical protein